MISQHLRRLLGDQTAFIGLTGFTPDFERAITELEADTSVVNLDQVDELPDLPSRAGSIVLLARTTTDLHRAAGFHHRLPSGKHLIIAVTNMAPQSRPVSTALPTTPAWSSLTDFKIVRGPESHWRTEARLERVASIGTLLQAVIAPRRRNLAPRSPRLGVVGPNASYWTAGAHAVRVPSIAPGTEPSAYPEADIALTTAPAERTPTWEGHTEIHVRPEPRRFTGRSAYADPVHTDPFDVPIPPVDECTVNPIGFVAEPDGEHAELRYDGEGWTVVEHDREPLALPGDGTVTDVEIGALRRVRSLRIDWNSHTGSTAALRSVAGLAAAGVPLISRSPAPMWAMSLHKELLAEIDKYGPDDLEDRLLREMHSIRVRRIALREYSTHAEYRRIRGLGEQPVSAILCTRRPEYLASITDQINQQRHSRVELVMVLHGIDRSLPEVEAALRDLTIPSTVVEAPSSTVFGEALNLGFGAASGAYVAKFDDDDWYSPHHLTDLLHAHRYSGAELVGAQTELVHVEEFDRTVRKRYQDAETFTTHLSGGTLLLRRDDFLAVGGYRPLPRSEDRGLLQDVLDSGGSIYKMHALGYVLTRRASGHTWDEESSYFLRDNVRQWPGLNLGRAVVADDLEPCVLHQ
ncbi:glycosyltransferase family 2 protein [Glycomyces tarimensis]